MDSLKRYLLHSKEFVLNRVNDRFHKSENGIGYLVTHLDRVLYFLARASSLFNFLPQLECLLQRAHQMFVVLGGDDNSLHNRLMLSENTISSNITTSSTKVSTHVPAIPTSGKGRQNF